MIPSTRIARLAPLLLILWVPGRLASQAPRFTVDDVLDVRSATMGDLSDDGRWLVITTATLRDRLGADQSRFGDPTYLAPSVAEISVVDTRTGEARKLFTDKRQARAFAWSPDGSHLAFLLREGDAFRLALWERQRNRLRTGSLPAGRIVADNAPLQWSSDGSKLLFSLRPSEWQRLARERFLQEIAAPIVVQSSDDAFLSWEEIRSLSARQIPAVYHVAGGRVQELMPETALGGLALTADGSALRFEEDVTTKTDYTQIFGRERRLLVRPVDSGEPRTLLPSLKDIRHAPGGGAGGQRRPGAGSRRVGAGPDRAGPRPGGAVARGSRFLGGRSGEGPLGAGPDRRRCRGAGAASGARRRQRARAAGRIVGPGTDPKRCGTCRDLGRSEGRQRGSPCRSCPGAGWAQHQPLA